MRTHNEIDRRSLAMALEITARIDADPQHKAVETARATCSRWLRTNPASAVREWCELLKQDWCVIRNVLLDEGEEGCRLRQSNPFCGVLSARERWAIYRRSHHEPQTA